MNNGKIFIVDDDRVSLRILHRNLERAGYDCVAIENSNYVLELARNDPPDLFLLDFLMPELNGVELCQLLKREEVFKNIPVIFITAVEETSQKLEAFKAGAVDYITKPINLREVGMRVRTHLDLFRTRMKLEEYARDMERLAEERARQLMQRERLVTLGIISSGVLNEIDRAITFIHKKINILEKSWDIFNRGRNDLLPNSVEKGLDAITDETYYILNDIKDGVSRIRNTMDNLKSFTMNEPTKRAPCRLAGCIENALAFCGNIIKDNIRLESKVDDKNILIMGDSKQIEQVMVNLIVNAVDAAAGVKDAYLCIEVFQDNGLAIIIVSDNAPEVDADTLSKIWDPFLTTDDSGTGRGLGLSIVRSIVKDHGGEIKVISKEDGGMNFHISLPLYIGEEVS